MFGFGYFLFCLIGRVSGLVFSKSGFFGNVFFDSEVIDWFFWIL